jgi:hypothetical protein
VELILLPVLLDLLLWLGPRFSVAPLLDRLAAAYSELAGGEDVTPELAALVEQLSASIRTVGEGSNLLNGLVSSALLHVPSLPLIPVELGGVVEIASAGEAFGWWLLFGLLGLLIGVFYLTLLARRLPIGGMAGARPAQVTVAVLRHWLQVCGFVLLMAIGLFLIYLPISLVVGMITLFSPAFGSALAALAVAFTLVVFFYLYFVTAALVMDNAPLPGAITRSLRLVQGNFWPTLGFIVLSNLITLGIALLLFQLAGVALWSGAVAIAINAYIGTGLSLALLVFYRSRLIKGAEPEPVSRTREQNP